MQNTTDFIKIVEEFRDENTLQIFELPLEEHTITEELLYRYFYIDDYDYICKKYVEIGYLRIKLIDIDHFIAIITFKGLYKYYTCKKNK